MTNETNKLKDSIEKQMSSVVPMKLCHDRQRLLSSTETNRIGVSPESYLDLISNRFDKRQWNYLSLGPSYIRLNQSATRLHKQQKSRN
ncbi:unnamed protein product [Rotaria sp. Silwood1]|nr:unnamed protein product [Rotaria sp. Silwood1]CAF1660042.1 unnamed protein product [Rotaria sp. Silwood1]CAF3821549.1 unnamed protein product [Rotaria sp. Silwood1]CAF3912673.1 unnamed protein product [Rotaria sp. Silwood1]CAF4940893.1 unnamed protein product [Rotaria sp. Silwood1]